MSASRRTRAFARVLAGLPARQITGAFWHQGPTGRSFLSFASPARGDGRYHREGDDGAWYASSKERAAWGELFRHHASVELSFFEVRRRVGKAAVRNLNALDLTDPTVRALLGAEEVDLIGDDRSLCQDIADAARSIGFEGVLAPSAAFAGERTLVVFPAGMRKVREEHSRVQRPPNTIRRELRRVRSSARAKLTIRRRPSGQ